MRAGHLIRTTLLLAAIAAAITACGRRPTTLDTPHAASERERREAEQDNRPVPPARDKPAEDRPFILDSLI